MASSQDIIPHADGSDGWLPAEEPTTNQEPQTDVDTAASATRLRRSTSKRKPARTGSTSRHSSVQPPEVEGVALVDGAVPTVDETSEEDLKNRALSANNSLTPKQRSRIAKSEAKDGRRISKIIKEEGKTEKQAVDIAINELEELQRFQRNAVKSEARAHANHTKSLFAFKKTEAVYLNAKLRRETALAELAAEDDAIAALKNSSKEATELVQEKSAQVDSLRTTLAVDERERELRLSNLKGSTVKN